MNKIEQVKAVYRTYYGVEIRDDCAEEISQLFEPKAAEGRLLYELRTPKHEAIAEQIHDYLRVNEKPKLFNKLFKRFSKWVEDAEKAQDAKTAGDKDRECQKRVEVIFAELEDYFTPLGDVMPTQKGSMILTIFRTEWEALKEREGSCTD